MVVMYEYVAGAYGTRITFTARHSPNRFVYRLYKDRGFLLMQMSLFLANQFCAFFLLHSLSNCFVWQHVTFSSPATSSKAALLIMQCNMQAWEE